MCVTPKRPCCKTPPYRFGEWFYPNGSAVSVDGSGNSFFRDRGDDGTIRLHRRGVASLSAAMGQYCCEILNINDVIHRLCVHFSELYKLYEASKCWFNYIAITIIQLTVHQVYG